MLVTIFDTGRSKVPLLHPEDDDAPGNNLDSPDNGLHDVLGDGEQE